jgi:hypothetical protein
MLKLTLVGGATAILNYAGLCWLTDPSLSPPGEYAGGLVKTTGPAIESAACRRSTSSWSPTSITGARLGRGYTRYAGEGVCPVPRPIHACEREVPRKE